MKELDPFREEIRRSASLDERPEDLTEFVKVIANQRNIFLGGNVVDHIHVALIVSCVRPFPGKPPKYSQAAKSFRMGFRNIASDARLQLELQSALRQPLLEDPLEKFDFEDINNLFDTRRGWGRARVSGA